MKKDTQVACMICLVLLFAGRAGADTITCNPCQLTSRSVGQGLSTMPGLSLVGPEFPGLFLEHPTVVLSDWFDWSPGQALDVTLAGSSFEGFGDVLTEPGWHSGFDVTMRFAGPEPVFTGPAPWWGGPNVGYGGPFSMTGRITGPDFDRHFLGTGRADIWWAADGSRASHVSFNFEEPAPVPEPGTMFLLTVGLGLLARHRRTVFPRDA